MAFSSPGLTKMVEQYAADQLEREILWVLCEPFTAPTTEQKQKARETVERIVAEGKLMEVLEATAPKPCPECGRI